MIAYVGTLLVRSPAIDGRQGKNSVFSRSESEKAQEEKAVGWGLPTLLNSPTLRCTDGIVVPYRYTGQPSQ
jgi:hypothetical protein